MSLVSMMGKVDWPVTVRAATLVGQGSCNRLSRFLRLLDVSIRCTYILCKVPMIAVHMSPHLITTTTCPQANEPTLGDVAPWASTSFLCIVLTYVLWGPFKVLYH